MEINYNLSLLKELHSDLAWKYEAYASVIETLWRSFSKDQRATCIIPASRDGKVLKHSSDTSLVPFYTLCPELNWQDISTEPEFMLNHLKYRATTSLFRQYCVGALGKPGDRNFILTIMKQRNIDPSKFLHNSYTCFTDEQYGDSVTIVHGEKMDAFESAIKSGLYVPQMIGNPIVRRQLYIFYAFNDLVENILNLRSPTRPRKRRSKHPERMISAVVSRLTIQEGLGNPSLPKMLSIALDISSNVFEFARLLYESVELAHAVKVWFFSRPELVKDNETHRPQIVSDKHISSVFFEMVHNAIKRATIWQYMSELLTLLQCSNTDKIYESMILQEISNVCHLEYSCAQAQFTRHVQTGIGAKYFIRVANSYDKDGNAKVKMRIQPKELTRADPYLHFILRLCQPQTDAREAIEWIKKLYNFRLSHHSELRNWTIGEADALQELSVIILFIRDLSLAVSMPAPSRKKTQSFVSWSQKLDAELYKLRDKIDLREFMVPINNLLEPGMTSEAIRKLKRFLFDKTGSNMRLLYEEIKDNCLDNIEDRCLENQYQGTRAKLQELNYIPLPTIFSTSVDKKAEPRKIKEKTRPCQSTASEIMQTPEAPKEDPIELTQVFKVSQSVSQVFSTLFNKSEARGSVNWTAFEGAMVELGFFVMPKDGSAYTFSPPESMNEKKSFTVHRPHKSRIEGNLILYSRAG